MVYDPSDSLFVDLITDTFLQNFFYLPVEVDDRNVLFRHYDIEAKHIPIEVLCRERPPICHFLRRVFCDDVLEVINQNLVV